MKALLFAAALTLAAPAFAAEPARPAEDVARDAARHPAEMVAFAGIKSGDKVVEFLPSAGYFSRVFSQAVGPQGHVYLLVPAQVADKFEFGANAKALAAVYPNTSADIVDLGAFRPEPVDVLWTSQNYHDLHNEPAGVAERFNVKAYSLLKPGGTYIVLDHAAAAGSGARDTNTLHRIDPELVKAEVMAAGFEFVGESKAVANAADDHTKLVFDPAIRGKTDQFVYKFRKPQ